MDILILFILIFFNGFFALSEIALVSSKRARVEQLMPGDSKRVKMTLHLIDDSEKFLSAIQTGISLIAIITGVFGGVTIAEDVAPVFERLEFTAPYASQISLSLTVIVITYVSIVIGELVPKTVALSNPEKIAVAIAPAIYYFSAVFYPFVKLLAVSTSLINRLLGIRKRPEQVTEAELRQMIKIASHEGVIEKEQDVIHEKVFYFSDKKAKHLMTHRTDLEWIDINSPPAKIRNKMLIVKHSKVICGKGTPDNVQGLIYLKDYFKALSTNKDIRIAELLVHPLVIHENMGAQRVLDRLRRQQSHICFVVDEFGGFEGIITLHDIFENIVGQIADEGDVYEPEVFIRNDKSVIVNGNAPVETLVQIIENLIIDFEKIDYSTVAGFMIDHLDPGIPKTGDKFEHLDYTFEIIDMDGAKIDKILITKNDTTAINTGPQT